MAHMLGPVLKVGLTALVLGPTAMRAEPEQAVRVLVQRFFDAYARKDFNGFMAMWSDASPELAVRRNTMQRIFAETGPIEVKNLEMLRVTVEGDIARVWLQVDLAGYDPRTEMLHPLLGKLSRLLELVREGDAWKIRRYMTPEQELAERVAAAASERERKQLIDEAGSVDRVQLAGSLINLVTDAYQKGQVALAAPLLDLAFSIAEGTGHKVTLARCYIVRSMALSDEAKYSEALEKSRQALAVAREAGSGEWEARALFCLGRIQGLLKSDGSIESYEASATLARALNIKGLLAAVLDSLGLAQMQQSKLAEAAKSFEESAKLLNEAGDRLNEAQSLSHLGRAQGAQGKFVEAAQSFAESARIAREIKSAQWEAIAQANLALAYAGLNRFFDAVKADEAALNIYRRSGDKTGEGKVLKHIGRMYRRMGRYADAAEASEAGDKLQREAERQAKDESR
jgi:tetratricopeptide (TPR) repeat protein